MRRYSFHHPIKMNSMLIGWVPFLYCSYAWRSCAAHNAYVTPSRNHLGLLPEKASKLNWIKKYKNNITYHATWRANLFFLMLIACYKRQRFIQLASTKHQYGKGVWPYLQACHSSPFPGLSDRDFYEIRIRARQTCFFNKSFLSHWNAMTVGCPVLVNEFDSFLEGRGAGSVYRKNLLVALNQCSAGICDPLVGMQIFYLTMLMALNDRHIFLDRCEPWERRAAQRVIALQKRGMFRHATKDPRLKKSFVKTILQWDGDAETFDDVCLKTQKLLLEGNEHDGERFLRRFNF